MTQCWSEGELRAYLDGELPSRDMDRVAAHIRECAACRGLCGDLAGRADRIHVWMDSLPDALAPIRLPAVPRRVRTGRQMAGAAVGLAAALLLGIVLLPKHGEVVSAPRVVVQKSPSPAPPPVQPAIIRRETPPHAAPVKPKPKLQYYVALDNEPIETGLVVRVGLNGGQIPADVIVGPDGRARAIRLVSEISGESK